MTRLVRRLACCAALLLLPTGLPLLVMADDAPAVSPPPSPPPPSVVAPPKLLDPVTVTAPRNPFAEADAKLARIKAGLPGMGGVPPAGEDWTKKVGRALSVEPPKPRSNVGDGATQLQTILGSDTGQFKPRSPGPLVVEQKDYEDPICVQMGC